MSADLSGVYKERRPKHRVLVVEDDLDLHFVLEAILKSIDPWVELDWATNAEHATLQLKESVRAVNRPYDLIVADIFLDGESTGIDLWNDCHEICPEVPIVIMSSLSTHKYLAALGTQAICPPFLSKPLELTECKQLFEGMFTYGHRTRKGSLAGSDGGFSKPDDNRFS